jgi:hypothetical protein
MILPARPNLWRNLTALVLLALGSGCTTPEFTDPARTGPFFKPTNFNGVPSLPSGLRRVMLLPLSGGGVTTSEMSASFDPVFTAALQKENRFEVVTLSREDLLRKFGVEELASHATLPRDFMSTLRHDYAVDAVLFVDLTALSAYRPLSIGVRAKLANAEDAQLLWSFDTVFSAADAAVANSARRHILKQDRSAAPADLSPAVLQSPSRFAGYVAAAMFATLPPVYSPPKIEAIPR